MKIAASITELVGHTPLLEFQRYNSAHKLHASIVGKLEYFNPCGSVKDRTALAMIDDAQNRGLLVQGSTLIEPTSGNTGVGLAMVAAVRGYKLVLLMPETMSIERRKLLQALGAEIVLTPGTEGMKGAIARANELRDQTPGSIILSQFENPANPDVHRRTTAQEIWDDTQGAVDFLVAGVGTGGTITGAGSRLKELNPNIKIIAAEPAESPVLSGGKAGPHKIQGIGAGFIPKVVDTSVIDEIVTVASADAIATAQEIARSEGVLAGISSGAAIWAATQIAASPENAGKRIVVILPDTAERYISTALFDFGE